MMMEPHECEFDYVEKHQGCPKCDGRLLVWEPDTYSPPDKYGASRGRNVPCDMCGMKGYIIIKVYACVICGKPG